MLTIGTLVLPHPFIQAAMSGYSDLPMRRVARRFGAAYAISEVVLDRSVNYPSEWQRRLLDVPPDDHPVAAQIMGADPDHFGPAARRLVDAGYDVIDLNFGCPAPRVVGRCRGGYLLSTPDLALDMVDRVLDAVAGERPVTLKMRRGVDDAPASERSFFEILEGAFDRGVAAVTVHGRTVSQRYRGASCWSFLQRVKRAIGDRTLLGSGDLFAAADGLRMIAETGVDGVTLARGSLGNPWIFRECLALRGGQPMPKPPDLTEQARVLRLHADEIRTWFGERAGAKMLAKIGIRYARHHPKPRQVRAAFNQVRHRGAFHQVLQKWYPPSPADGYGPPSSHLPPAEATCDV